MKPVWTDITVRQQNGTYVTSSIKGIKASCTVGERQAAERMGDKLYAASFLSAEMVSIGKTFGSTRWRLHSTPQQGSST